MARLRIGAVIFPEFEMLDVYGWLEFFSIYRGDFEICVVAETHTPVPASGGPATVPDAVFADGSDYDIVMVPGGAGSRKQVGNPVLRDWLQATDAHATWMTSVCTGAMVLADAGLLDGRRATTNKRAFDEVALTRPQVLWQRHARWVRDDKYVTSSGVSAGMDMAVYLIDLLLGPDKAEDAAYMAEYVANRNRRTDPFAPTGDPT